MLIRASIVLLIVLNLGVAAWWLAAPAAPSGTSTLQREGVPRLQLLHEQGEATVAHSASSGAAAAAAAAATGAAASAAQGQAEAATTVGVVDAAAASTCFSLGPFDAEPAANAAAGRLRNRVANVRTRRVPASGASAYNVFLPPSGSRVQAQAAAEKIGAAGFDDFLVVNTGEMANAVALGRYGSLEVAQRRQAALQAAGFAAQVDAVGATTPAQWWLDARAPAGGTGQNVRVLAGASESRTLDCALLR